MMLGNERGETVIITTNALCFQQFTVRGGHLLEIYFYIFKLSAEEGKF